MDLVPTIETDHPLILGKQPRSEYFHYATKDYGGLLDLARCDFASQADFSLATHRIKRSLDFWLERNDVCSKFLGDLNVGFIVNQTPNAYAIWRPTKSIIAITSGFVWLINDLLLTLFSHPSFLTIFGDPSKELANFNKCPDGFAVRGAVLDNSSRGLFLKPHAMPIDDVRHLYAREIASLVIEFAFYHELGHLLSGHSAFLATQCDAPAFAEMSKTGEIAGLSLSLLRALEFEADHFAVHAALGNGLMFESAPDNDSDLQARYGLWAMALALTFRLFSQSGRTVNETNALRHPHPLSRSSIVSSWVYAATKLKFGDREKASVWCGYYSMLISQQWKEFQLPGHQFDPLARGDHLDDVAPQIASAIELLARFAERATPYRRVDVSSIITNGSETDWSRIGAESDR